MAGKLIGLGAFANDVGTYGNGTHLGLRGLDPSDPCYDPSAFSLWNSSSECACMAAHPDLYSFSQQCVNWTPGGVAAAFGYPVGAVVKGVVGGAVQGATPSPTDYSSYIGYGIAALVGIVILAKAL